MCVKADNEVRAATSAAASVAVVTKENGCWRRFVCNLLNPRATRRASMVKGKLPWTIFLRQQKVVAEALQHNGYTNLLAEDRFDGKGDRTVI